FGCGLRLDLRQLLVEALVELEPEARAVGRLCHGNSFARGRSRSARHLSRRGLPDGEDRVNRRVPNCTSKGGGVAPVPNAARPWHTRSPFATGQMPPSSKTEPAL